MKFSSCDELTEKGGIIYIEIKTLFRTEYESSSSKFGMGAVHMG
jgi:hypothetical protein